MKLYSAFSDTLNTSGSNIVFHFTFSNDGDTYSEYGIGIYKKGKSSRLFYIPLPSTVISSYDYTLTQSNFSAILNSIAKKEEDYTAQFCWVADSQAHAINSLNIKLRLSNDFAPTIQNALTINVFDDNSDSTRMINRSIAQTKDSHGVVTNYTSFPPIQNTGGTYKNPAVQLASTPTFIFSGLIPNQSISACSFSVSNSSTPLIGYSGIGTKAILNNAIHDISVNNYKGTVPVTATFVDNLGFTVSYSTFQNNVVPFNAPAVNGLVQRDYGSSTSGSLACDISSTFAASEYGVMEIKLTVSTNKLFPSDNIAECTKTSSIRSNSLSFTTDDIGASVQTYASNHRSVLYAKITYSYKFQSNDTEQHQIWQKVVSSTLSSITPTLYFKKYSKTTAGIGVNKIPESPYALDIFGQMRTPNTYSSSIGGVAVGPLGSLNAPGTGDRRSSIGELYCPTIHTTDVHPIDSDDDINVTGGMNISGDVTLAANKKLYIARPSSMESNGTFIDNNHIEIDSNSGAKNVLPHIEVNDLNAYSGASIKLKDDIDIKDAGLEAEYNRDARHYETGIYSESIGISTSPTGSTTPTSANPILERSITNSGTNMEDIWHKEYTDSLSGDQERNVTITADGITIETQSLSTTLAGNKIETPILYTNTLRKTSSGNNIHLSNHLLTTPNGKQDGEPITIAAPQIYSYGDIMMEDFQGTRATPLVEVGGGNTIYYENISSTPRSGDFEHCADPIEYAGKAVTDEGYILKSGDTVVSTSWKQNSSSGTNIIYTMVVTKWLVVRKAYKIEYHDTRTTNMTLLFPMESKQYNSSLIHGLKNSVDMYWYTFGRQGIEETTQLPLLYYILGGSLRTNTSVSGTVGTNIFEDVSNTSYCSSIPLYVKGYNSIAIHYSGTSSAHASRTIGLRQADEHGRVITTEAKAYDAGHRDISWSLEEDTVYVRFAGTMGYFSSDFTYPNWFQIEFS